MPEFNWNDSVNFLSKLTPRRLLNMSKVYSSYLVSKWTGRSVQWGMPISISFEPTTTCDLVVQPYFTTTSEGTAVKTTVNVTVNGYPASYRNIRMYEPKDSANFKIKAFVNNYENKPITNESTEEPLKKKKKNIGWIVAGAAALVYLIAAGV